MPDWSLKVFLTMIIKKKTAPPFKVAPIFKTAPQGAVSAQLFPHSHKIVQSMRNTFVTKTFYNMHRVMMRSNQVSVLNWIYYLNYITYTFVMAWQIARIADEPSIVNYSTFLPILANEVIPISHTRNNRNTNKHAYLDHCKCWQSTKPPLWWLDRLPE